MSETTRGASTHVEVMPRVNGSGWRLWLDSRMTLLGALRGQLNLAATKKGCDQGRAGGERSSPTASAC